MSLRTTYKSTPTLLVLPGASQTSGKTGTLVFIAGARMDLNDLLKSRPSGGHGCLPRENGVWFLPVSVESSEYFSGNRQFVPHSWQSSAGKNPSLSKQSKFLAFKFIDKLDQLKSFMFLHLHIFDEQNLCDDNILRGRDFREQKCKTLFLSSENL